MMLHKLVLTNRRVVVPFFFFESAFIFRNKQTSAKTQRASMGPNVRGVSTGGIWLKVRGVGEV